MSPFPCPDPASLRAARGDSAATLTHLHGLLELARLVGREADLDKVLATVARAVSETLGFATVVVNLYRPETDEYEVRTVHGSDAVGELLLGQVTTADSWSGLLIPAFRRRGAYFVPAGTFDWETDIKSYAPPIRPGPDAPDDAWHADDAMFIPLDGPGGRRYGIISVDEPNSRRRPDDQQLDVLNAVAAHATLAIESAFQVAALETAVARHEAVIEASLDGMVAIDASLKVVEFNPAAERTFGFRRDNVIGTDVVDVLVLSPTGARTARRVLAECVADPKADILGRHVETFATTADGTVSCRSRSR